MAADLAEAVTGTDVVIAMLSDAQVTRDVIAAAMPSPQATAIIVQMGTIGVEGTRELAEVVAQAPEMRLVDAPVSGTKGPAIAGPVTILASGPDTALDALEPVFDVIGGRTVRLGEAGAGTQMKLVLNAWLVAVMNGIAEAAAIGRQFDIGYEQLIETLAGGPLDTPYAVAKIREFDADDYTPI